MYKKKLESSNIPELKSIYDNDLEKNVFDKDQQKVISNEVHDQHQDQQKVISNDHQDQHQDQHDHQDQHQDQHRDHQDQHQDQHRDHQDHQDQHQVISNEHQVISNDDMVISNDESSSEKSITFNRIKKKVVRKIMFIKNKIKTNSVDYKLDLINDAINKINERINLLEIKVNNLELDINKNKNELIEHDRLTTMEMTNINDKLNNANIIILD